MTKAELVARLAEQIGSSKAAAEKTLDAFLASVEDTLAKEGKLTLTGFGTFLVEARQARKGRNPRTGEVIEIPASKVVKFRVGKQLKDSVQ